MIKYDKPTYLVCAPKHYEVSYVINPWMHPDDWANERDAWKEKSNRQWNAMCDAMRAFNWDIKEAEQLPNMPDMVFVADHAFTLEGKALISFFATRERGPEAEHLKKWYGANGFETIDAGYMFEGGGDIIYDIHYDVIWMGYGFRTSALIKGQLEKVFGKRVLPLALKNPNFYHCDTCFCPLKNGWVMLTASAFTVDALENIKSVYGDKIIYVDDTDAAAFGCNAVVAGNQIMMPTVSDELTKRLEGLGFTTQQLALDSYIISGGASRCLTHNLCE